MKRLTLTAYLLLLAIIISNAQENKGADNPLFFGVKVGGVHSTFRTDYQFKFAEHRLGLVAGGNVGYKINELLSVQLDALYVQEGASYVPSNYLYHEPNLTSSNNDLEVQRLNSNVVLHSVEAPLRVNVHLGKGDLKPKVFAGAAINYIFYAEAKNKVFVYDNADNYYAEVSGRTTNKVTSKFKDYYIGGILGASIGFPVFGFETEVEARLKVGAQQVNNLETLQLNNQPSIWEAPESFLDDVSVQTLMITYGIKF